MATKIKHAANVDPHPDVKIVGARSGCKVHWETVATEADAKLLSEWAQREGTRREAMGYDSGYCSPGRIDKVKNGFEICIL